MKTILGVILVLFLTGCAHHEIIPADRAVDIDPKLLQPCELLNTEVKITSFNDVILEYSALSTKYGVCANRQADSIKLIKQFGNIK
jgi:hypothetical protein